MFKPFKPLTLTKPAEQPRRAPPEAAKTSPEPPHKKRKVRQNDGDEAGPPPPAKVAAPSQTFRRPLINVTNPAVAAAAAASVPDSPPLKQPEPPSQAAQYTVLWRKKTNKKNKTWDGDGFLRVSDGYATLKDSDGSMLGKTACKVTLSPGSTISMAGKEVEIDSIMSKADINARKSKSSASQARSTFQPPRTSLSSGALKSLPTKFSLPSGSGNIHSRGPELLKRVNNDFKNPMLQSTTTRAKVDDRVPVPRHDPTAPGALVMKRPASVESGKHIVDVVVDPILTKNLRAHQREGVAFLYECVMGMRPFDGEGAILADEMGLGKTLQTIALIWTLLKQNPVYGDQPVIKKVLIVCPATLINNWRKEFLKWLGKERIGVMVAESNKTRFTDFTKGKSYSVMIIGYEKLRNVQAELQKGSGVDLVIADEGHRLKTAQNKSAMAIKSLNTERRIILSGTPIQNDLSEFYTMVDFVNPGLLNKYSTFKKDFEGPILKSRLPGVSAKDLEKGRDRSSELASLTGQFILRRTAEILAQYLPPKTEYVLFCRPTDIQVACYESVISTGVFDKALKNSETSLQLINILKKVCNNPKLLLSKKADKDEEGGAGSTLTAITAGLPTGHLRTASGSSKLHVLDSLLHRLSTTTDEKVVIVSNYTATLDMLGKLLTALDYPHSRLDGSTPVGQRQDLVDRFNISPASSSFAFLLSAKAGGVGINLIGASRLILYDIDWNPAIDLQAMARIHRDGQKRPCHIYRLLTKGALEEKIYQRQLTKQDLSDSIVDNKQTASTFSPEELRDLFSLDRRTTCQTHDSLNCACGGKKAGGAENISAAPSPPPGRDDVDDEGDDENGDNDNDDDKDNDDDESLPDLQPLPSFVPCSQIDVEAEEQKLQARKRRERATMGKLQSLMKYSHIDTTLFRDLGNIRNNGGGSGSSNLAAAGNGVEEDADDGMGVVNVDGDVDGIDVDVDEDQLALETAIEDPVLRAVVAEEGSRVDFIFARTN